LLGNLVCVNEPHTGEDTLPRDLAALPENSRDLEPLARAFLDAAMARLAEERVLPASAYRPWIRAGVDYPGPVVLELPEARVLEEAIEVAMPERFKRLGPRVDTHSPHQYLFGLLESTVAELTIADEPYAAASSAAKRQVREFEALMTAEECAGSVVVFVSGIRLTAPSLPIGRLEARRVDTLLDEVLREIPEVADDLDELLWSSHGLPWEAGRLVFRGDWDPTVGHTPFETVSVTSEIDALIAATRLLTNATVVKNGTVIGQSQPLPVHRGAREIEANHDHLIAWRPFQLSAETLGPLLAMKRWLSTTLGRDKPRAHVMSVAAGRFHAALDRQFWDEQLLELAIGLEAALLGGDKDGEITYRLRTRAAALLTTDAESPERVFDEIGALYEMRSSLVHGAPIGDRDRRHLLTAMQSSRASELMGERFAVIVDRARDLLRRAIIARLCLSEGERPLWPWSAPPRFSVDRALLNPSTAQEWRAFVRARAAELGFPQAFDPAAPVSGLLGQPRER
jgi:Apea-like HEPN